MGTFTDIDEATNEVSELEDVWEVVKDDLATAVTCETLLDVRNNLLEAATRARAFASLCERLANQIRL